MAVIKFKSEILLTVCNLELPDVSIGDDLASRVVLNTAVHEVAVLADICQRVTRAGLGYFLTLLVEFLPLKLVGLSQQKIRSYNAF